MNEWKEFRLGDLIDLNYGKSLISDKRVKGEIPVYSSSGITGYHNTPLVNSEGIIVGRKGTVGSVFYSPIPFYCIDTAYYILPSTNYHLPFLFYLLKTVGFANMNEDSAVPGLNRENAYSLTIALPPPPLQHRIAEILGALDDKIELNRQMNHTLEEMAQARYKHYFLENIDPENLPVGWSNGRFGDLCYVQNGYAFKSSSFNQYGDARIIKITNINSGRVDIEDTQFVSFNCAKEIDNKFHIASGDYLIAMTGAEVGKVGIVPNHNETILLNQRVGNLKDVLKYGAALGFTILSTPMMQEKLFDTAIGSAQPNISGSDIESIETIIPTVEFCNSFGALVQLFYDQISQSLYEIQTLKRMRDTLLPKLISGELVPDDLQTIEQAL